MDGLFSDEELFLTQNSFSEERVEDNFSIDCILDGLVGCDEPVSQNSCKEELKQVVTEKSIKDGRTDPSNYPEAVRKIVIVDDEELEKRKESRRKSKVHLNNWKVKKKLWGIYLYKSLKRGIYTDKSLIYNAIQFISPALPCYIIKLSPDFQLV